MISVCLATYNGGKYIREQLDSILCQLSEHDELIISDDGSCDDTIDIISSYQDERIILLNNKGKHGFVWNFENALRYAKGDIIFLSDQDDIWMTNKVEKVLERIEQYDLIVHDAEIINGDGKIMGKTYYSTTHKGTSFLANLWKTRWLGCCMAFTREVLDASLPFPPKIVAHDYWIGMFAMRKFKYCFINDKLIYYRRHNNNTSSSGEKSKHSVWYKIFTKRLYIIKAILSRH